MKSKLKISIIINIILLVVVAILIVILQNNYDDTKKAVNFSGTYAIGEQTNDNAKIIAINKSDDSAEYCIYNHDKIINQDKYKNANDNYIVMFDNNKIKAYIFYTNDKFYIINDNLESQEIKKISDTPITIDK